VSIATLAALPGDGAARLAAAVAQLEVLVDLFDRGAVRAAPLVLQDIGGLGGESASQAEAVSSKLWEPTNDFGLAEGKEPEHQLVHGGVVPFSVPPAGRTGAGRVWRGVGGRRVDRFGR